MKLDGLAERLGPAGKGAGEAIGEAAQAGGAVSAGFYYLAHGLNHGLNSLDF